MKRNYSKPQIEVIEISSEDIITYSPLEDGGNGDGGWVDFEDIVNG